jgi:hypothetical protein
MNSLKDKADKAKEALEAGRAELLVIEAKVRTLYLAYETAYDKYVADKISTGEDNIALILDGTNHSKTAYSEYQKKLAEYKLLSGGEWSTTRQRCIGVAFIKNPINSSDNELQIQGLKKLKPYIISLTVGECTGKPFNIMERTLSEHGVYQGLILDDDSIVVTLTRYGRTTFKHFDTFDKGMDYIQRKHWYRNEDSDDVADAIDC